MDEFLAELDERMAAATRADGLHPPLTAEALQIIAAADQGGTPMFTSATWRASLRKMALTCHRT